MSITAYNPARGLGFKHTQQNGEVVPVSTMKAYGELKM